MSANSNPLYLKLQGLSDVVAFCPEMGLEKSIAAVFQNWPFEISGKADNQVFASIVRTDNSFRLESPYMEKPLRFRNATDALCALVVETAWALLREKPELLCLHGAAIEIGGRLVVIPNTRRAGKSTLTTVLAARGHRVFTDDFLPIHVSGGGRISGLGCGIAPRLRLPAPNDLDRFTQKYIENSTGLANQRYAYINPRENQLAAHGASASFGGFVLLERDADATPGIISQSRGEILKALIVQNFSRSMNAAGIIKILEFLACNVPGYLLRAQNAEQAADMIEKRFAAWDSPQKSFPVQDYQELFRQTENIGTFPASAPCPDIRIERFLQARDTTLTELDGSVFVTGSNGRTIHYLNEGAQAVWGLLSEPTSLQEAIEIISAAFPATSSEQISKDTRQIFDTFSKNGLLEQFYSTEVQGISVDDSSLSDYAG